MENVIDDKLVGFILTNVQMYIGESIDDNLLKLYINMMCQNICIQTNRNKFPEALKYLVIDLVKDKFDSNNKTNSDIQVIQSISEAGRSVNYATSDIYKAKFELMIEKQLAEYDKLINRYKLLYKTGGSK